MSEERKRPQVVIVGGGFGGLYAARRLRQAPVDLTLIDRRNFHLFQPLLYQVATGALSPGEIASPLRYVLRGNPHARVWLAEVTDIDAERRQVIFSGGRVDYDFLVLATGANPHYFGHEQWAPFAPGLNTIEDATEVRQRIFSAFEHAEREPDEFRRRALLTFVIVGGGPTGVELAGALAEVANETLRNDFRNINPAEAEILLIEGTERVLPALAPDLSAKAELALIRLGVRPRTKAMVTAIEPGSVTLKVDDREERIGTCTVLWAAGVRASALGRVLSERTGAELDRAGRVLVGPDLSVPGHPEIFVIGDLSSFPHQTGRPLPGVAPVAMAEGRYVARLIGARARGKTLPPFRYFDKGSLATIGRHRAVADFGRLHLSGLVAWLAWLFVHLMYLVEFDNRLLVFIEWAYNYFTRNRGARLITGEAYDCGARRSG